MRRSKLLTGRHAELVSASHILSNLYGFRNKFKVTFLSLFVLCSLGRVSAQSAYTPVQNISQTSAVQPQPVDFTVCNKFFKINSQKLFYLTLASVNANRFEIIEIQSKSNYILFSVVKRYFLARVINIDTKNSMLKITPCDNIYFFPVGIVQNIFKYIELNINTPIQQLSVS